MKEILVTIFVIFSLGVLLPFCVKEDQKRDLVCEAKGGEILLAHSGVYCVKKGTILK